MSWICGDWGDEHPIPWQDFDVVGASEARRPEDAGDWRLKLITRMATEVGLDAQSFKCKSCCKSIGSS